MSPQEQFMLGTTGKLIYNYLVLIILFSSVPFAWQQRMLGWKLPFQSWQCLQILDISYHTYKVRRKPAPTSQSSASKSLQKRPPHSRSIPSNYVHFPVNSSVPFCHSLPLWHLRCQPESSMALRPVAKDGGGLRPFYTNTSHLLKVYIGRVVCVCGLRIFGERLMPTKNISTYPKKRGNILLETKSTNGLKKLPRQTHHTTDILPFLVVHESFMRQKAGVFFT